MASTTFLFNTTLWEEIAAQVKTARRVDAAIAYLGQGAARLMPLGRGHRLVVDMSLPTVKSGATDPREIEKLIRRGVKAFTRRNLHAKLIVADKSVVAGSANVSNRSKGVLDEAGISTNDTAVVRRARLFIDRLCTEPIRDEYLKTCKQQYRPPRLNGPQGNASARQKRVSHPKLWIVNLSDSSIPDVELKRYEQGEARALKLIRDRSASTPDSFHWSYKPRMADELETGDWLIQAIRQRDKSIQVFAPAQLLFVDSYHRDGSSGKRRWVFHLESPKRGQTMTWKRFRTAVQSDPKLQLSPNPRTQPIRDVRTADRLLTLWTLSGRISRRSR